MQNHALLLRAPSFNHANNQLSTHYTPRLVVSKATINPKIKDIDVETVLIAFLKYQFNMLKKFVRAGGQCIILDQPYKDKVIDSSSKYHLIYYYQRNRSMLIKRGKRTPDKLGSALAEYKTILFCIFESILYYLDL